MIAIRMPVPFRSIRGVTMKTLILAVVLTAGLAACGESERAADTAAAGAAAGDPSAGKAVADRHCKGCHGLDGKSAAPGIPNLAGQHERYLMTALNEYNEGKRTHAALRAVTAQIGQTDLRNIAAYYAALPAATSQHNGKAPLVFPYEAGKAKAAQCAKCHGADGNSKTPGVPSLAGQQPLYFVNAIQEYLRSERASSPMHATLGVLSKADRENLALYFASQTPAGRQAAAFGDPVAGEPLTAVCGGCHGPKGVSNDSATPSLAAQEPRYLVQAIKAYRESRKHGIMQRQIQPLSDRDIENIAAFYSVQSSVPAAKGQGLVQNLVEKCDRCHAGAADNPSMAVPRIAGQEREYLVMALRAYRDDRRESSVMHRMSLPFSDTVIESLAAVYASQQPK
jgi:cytochrome c553